MFHNTIFIYKYINFSKKGGGGIPIERSEWTADDTIKRGLHQLRHQLPIFNNTINYPICHNIQRHHIPQNFPKIFFQYIGPN
jgi:hypothetical protein